MSSVQAGWTSERIEILKKLFDAGLSCSQIAGEIGATRNAVIGKMHPLGLSRPKNLFANRVKPPRVKQDGWRAKALRPKGPGLSVSAQRDMLRAAHSGPAGPAAPGRRPPQCPPPGP